MKKIFLNILSLVAALTMHAADGKLTVKMDCSPVKGDTIVAITIVNGQQVPTTFTGKQGKFDFTLDLEAISPVYFAEPGALRGDRQAVVYQILGVPGEEVTVSATTRERYDVDGPGYYRGFHEADLMMEQAHKDGKDIPQAITEFVKARPDNEASIYFLSMIPDPEKMQQAYALLKPEVANGRFKSYYEGAYSQAKAQAEAEAEAAKKQAPGLPAPDFTLNDLDGKPLKLSSLRGKYVILDFWGSWCGWCIKGFPQMKEYYKKYAGKFEILGIDCNDSDKKWRDAVKKHELPWLHVYNTRESTVLSDYAIQGFPTKIIVGPDGKIVKTIVGEDPQFYTLLDELFSK